MRLSVLMTVYNEADFIDYAIRACLPYIDDLVVVEGAYQETIRLNKPPRSKDGTIDIIQKYQNEPKIHIIYTNQETDKDQRNVGLSKIKELNPDGWLLIIDGDEVYKPETFKIIKNLTKKLDLEIKKDPHTLLNYVCIFESLTFVNDFKHYTLQYFPRLMKITKECKFVNDNHMIYANIRTSDSYQIRKDIGIKFFHYSFLKGKDRFETKKQWWETRFGKPFDYGWKIDENNKISDKSHKIFEFTGKHPEIMKDHIKFNNE